MTPASFTQHRADFSTGPHPWAPGSEAIIWRNLAREDLPEPIVRVTLHMPDGSRVTLRRIGR